MEPAIKLIRFVTVFVLLSCTFKTTGQPFSFRKINSGTKAKIHTLIQNKQQEVYFLANKIYFLNENKWSKQDFPVEGEIKEFYPVSSADIWFSVDQVTNTSVLYHYHDGVTDNIRPPFANTITSISFFSKNTGILTSFADVAVYENGSFRKLPPAPTRFVIEKIFGKDAEVFYLLTNGSELFLYDHGVYKRVFENKIITDFCFTDIQDGYLLSGEEIFRVDASGIKPLAKSPDFRSVNRICLTANNTLILVGSKGLILSYSKGSLLRHSIPYTENLTDVVASGTENIWICGENGLLLYSGDQKFAEYVENNQGFSSHKLIYYGITIDDEYGVAMADFNMDSKTDIYSVRIYEQNRLYINHIVSSNTLFGNESFTEEAVKRNANGVIKPGSSTAQNELKLGISVADIDNDNDQDIYLCYLNSTNKLLLNKGNGYFRNVSEQKRRACENMNRSNAAAFADVDTDGDLDLFVTNEEGSNRLFENNGSGNFKDITATSGLASVSGGMCASFADVNNDGYPDLCVSFWYPSNKIYFNESKKGRIYFRDATHLTDIAGATPAKSNAVAFADVNNDGFIDLFIANRNTGNKLYLNDGKGIFRDNTYKYFKPDNFMSNGAVFADFDLDGYQDLYITNVGENILYKNVNGKYFTDVTSEFGAELSGYCTGCAAGDIDNDGDPDLYVANYINGDSKLFINNTETKSFVKFKLRGVRSNKDAIGAKVWLYKVAGNKKPAFLAGYRELNGGSGYGSISAKEMIFGVETGSVYYALIKFPSSPDTIRIEQILAGETKEIFEIQGLKAFNIETGNNLVRFFIDPEIQPEIIKTFLITLLLLLYNLQLRKNIRNIDFTRWLASGFILAVFFLVNQLFLFQWPSLSFFIAPIVALGLLAILDLFIGRILLRRFAQKEKLDLREKLSRDLHDDLASTLGSISIYAETLKGMNEPSKSDFKKLSVKIAGLTQSALQSISDIIWMTSPRNDSLQSLISKTSNYMLEILTDNKINFSSLIEIPEDPVILQEKIRNDAFLILKEGLHNIIRHSGAQNVAFKAVMNENSCIINLKDDGIGILVSGLPKKGSHGNGLVNMRRRAQESGIEIRIQSGEGTGTEIFLQFTI